jgi:hypothetical protein
MWDKIQEATSYFLITTGLTTATLGINLTALDLGMSLLLKFVSLASFICFLLINQDKISEGYKKVINNLYKKLKGKK